MTSIISFILYIVIAATLSVNPPVPPNPFVKVTSGPEISDSGWSFGVSWVDYDGDRYPDLFIANNNFSDPTEKNLFYHNNGNGTYTRITEGDIAASCGCLSATWADLDGDGDLDCYACRPFLNANLLFINDGSGRFHKDTVSPLVSDKKFSMEAQWIDYDKDGRLDLFVANHARPSTSMLVSFYHNDAGTFKLIKNSDIGLIEDEANGIAWCDYNNDRWPDLFWSRNNKLSILFTNQGNGTFAPTDNILSAAPAKYQGNWADFDNDGDFDIYAGTDSIRGITLYENIGDGRFELIDDTVLVRDTGSWAGGFWGDYDNDGFLDLFVTGEDTYEARPNRLYHNNGDGTFSRLTEGEIATDLEPSHAAAWADHDRDGDLDLYVANVNNVNNTLYQNRGNSNNWLQVELKGEAYNRTAIGAVIKAKAIISGKPVRQMREISSKNGFMSQSEFVTHFGLGDARTVDSLVIEWPDGTVKTLTDLPVNQYLSVPKNAAK
jgi:hypothetical protein